MSIKNGLKNIVLAILTIIITIGCIYAAIQWDKIVKKWETNAEREVFKETISYNEAAASFLADAYKQYNEVDSDKDKNSIMEYVVMRYPNLNYNNIDNKTLREFYRDCLDY